MQDRVVWTAERIRNLRGEHSRATFAKLLGVTELTVYRWELPDGAPEARRPRGLIKQRLDGYAAGTEHALPIQTPALVQMEMSKPAPEPDPDLHAAEEIGPEDMAELLPPLERLMQGDFRRAESALITLLSSNRLEAISSRILATQAVARIQLWARADVFAAFTTLTPLLFDAETGALPTFVEAEVYITAALVFGGLDGRIFDVGKMNSYIARAERALPRNAGTESRFLLWMAQAIAAFVSNEPPLVRRVLARASDFEQDLSSPLLRFHAEELRTVACYVDSRPQDAPKHLAEMQRLAIEGSFHYLHARFLSQAILSQIDDGIDPETVLAHAERANAYATQARAVPGWHSLFLAYATGEANVRLGHFDAARVALEEGIQIACDLRWSYGSMPLLLARILVLTGQECEIRPLGQKLLEAETVTFADAMRHVAEMVLAIADALDGVEVSHAVDRADESARAIHDSGVWTFLRRMVMLGNATLAMFAGDEEQAARALRRAERTLDTAPSVWGSAALRWLRGLLAYREGKLHEARTLHESALDAFTLAHDRLQIALVTWTLGAVLADLDAPNASEMVASAHGALEKLGVTCRPKVHTKRKRSHAGRNLPIEENETLARVVGPIARLSVRGMGPELLHREIVECLHELFPSATVRLEEIDSRGVSAIRHEMGNSTAVASESIEFGDGTGRRFRLSLAGRLLPDARMVLGTVANVASLALEVATLRGYVDRAPPPPAAEGDVPDMPEFVSASSVMRRLKADLARLSKSRANIIITGESGSGKEVVARAIHDLSLRATRPYVAFNCAAVPRDLFEGQLFGYRKEAFTGAATDQPGVIRAAETGTLFLDEIGELPLDVQPKLLRFLENGEILPLGERKPVRVDVRVVAATFRDLERLVREGSFREDLFYRLQVVPVHVPPLRERPEDAVALARHFLQRFTPQGHEPPVLAPDAISALTTYAWPGNVRELRNVIERALAFDPIPTVLTSSALRFG